MYLKIACVNDKFMHSTKPSSIFLNLPPPCTNCMPKWSEFKNRTRCRWNINLFCRIFYVSSWNWIFWCRWKWNEMKLFVLKGTWEKFWNERDQKIFPKRLRCTFITNGHPKMSEPCCTQWFNKKSDSEKSIPGLKVKFPFNENGRDFW